MRTLLAVTMLLLAAAPVACARPVPLHLEFASRADLLALEGEWRGEFDTDDSRWGFVLFDLERATERVSGEIVVPARIGYGRRETGTVGVTMSDPAHAEPRRILMRSLSVDEGIVSGTLMPFWDSTQRCDAWAMFSGTVSGDRMAGTFFVACADGGRQIAGRWHARRR